MLPSFGTQAANWGDRMKHSNNREESVRIHGPSSSLWPEPARPVPITTRGKRLNPTSSPDISNKAGRVLEDANEKQEESTDTKLAVSSNNLTTTRTEPSSTSRSSDVVSSPPMSRPIDVTVPKVFESRYPKWHSYPPIHPTRSETSTSTGFPMCTISDPMNSFLQQSNDFKNWVNKKNAERIQLRHGPDYEKLVDELHKFQRISKEGLTPQVRAAARDHMLEIKARMLVERKKFSAAELQHIRDIENAWISLVSMDNYGQEISRQRHLPEMPKVEAKRSLSKVESLLGWDGSSPEDYDWIQPPPTASRPALNKMSHEAAGLVFTTDINVKEPKEQKTTTSEKSLVLVGENPWTDNSSDILIPDWFHVVEAQGNIELSGATIEARFKHLLNHVYQLEAAKRQQEYKDKHSGEEGIMKDRKWDKHWHQPNTGWRHEHQKKLGGLWKCRKGPTATDAENNCRLCSTDETTMPAPASQTLEEVMKHIEAAMAIVAENDKNDAPTHTASENKKPARLEKCQWQIGDNTREQCPRQNKSHLSAAGPETTPFRGFQPDRLQSA